MRIKAIWMSFSAAPVCALALAWCVAASPAAAREAAPAPAHGTQIAPGAEGAVLEGTANPAAGSHDVSAAMHGAVASHSETPAHDSHVEGPTTPHLPNLVSIVLNLVIDEQTGRKLKDTHLGHVIHEWELQIFMLLVTAIGIWILWTASKLRALMPTRLQVFFEMVYEGFYNFIGGILGHHNTKYVPFLGSLFLFIYFQNVAGLLPLFTGGTAAYTTTIALALMVFFYVQFQGIKEAGFGHWALHFLGNPKDLFGWVMGIAMLPLEIIGALAKPLSLSLRLFGNMMGEHILVGVFLLMGIGLVTAFAPHAPIGVPLHLPFLFLGLLTTFIQALVFSLLSTIYLLLLLPHDDHHADEMHDMAHDEKHGMRDDHGQHVTAGDISPV